MLIMEIIFFDVYSPTSAKASGGRKTLAFRENKQVADAGKSSSSW
jgi:hypothetical protein